MIHIELDPELHQYLIELLSHIIDRYEDDAAALLRIADQRPVAQELAIERLDMSQTAAKLYGLLSALQ